MHTQNKCWIKKWSVGQTKDWFTVDDRQSAIIEIPPGFPTPRWKISSFRVFLRRQSCCWECERVTLHNIVFFVFVVCFKCIPVHWHFRLPPKVSESVCDVTLAHPVESNFDGKFSSEEANESSHHLCHPSSFVMNFSSIFFAFCLMLYELCKQCLPPYTTQSHKQRIRKN